MINVVKQRIFEESKNLKNKRLFLNRSFIFREREQMWKQKSLSKIRNKHKSYWSFYRFNFNLKKYRRRNFLYKKNFFFQSFYLYKLKRYLNYYKFFIFKHYNRNISPFILSDHKKILVEWDKFFGNKGLNLSFVNNVFSSSINLNYNFRYIKKEKLKFNYFFYIKKYKNFLKKIKKFFNSFDYNYSNLLVRFLEVYLVNIVYRSRLVFSLHNSNQLIKHGFIEVDGEVITSPKYSVGVLESVQFISSYKLYLKEIKLKFLLESYLKWYSGFYNWFSSNSDLLNKYYSLLFIFKFLRSNNTVFKSPYGNKFVSYYKGVSFISTSDNSSIGFTKDSSINFLDSFFNTFYTSFREVYNTLYKKRNFFLKNNFLISSSKHTFILKNFYLRFNYLLRVNSVEKKLLFKNRHLGRLYRFKLKKNQRFNNFKTIRALKFRRLNLYVNYYLYYYYYYFYNSYITKKYSNVSFFNHRFFTEFITYLGNFIDLDGIMHQKFLTRFFRFYRRFINYKGILSLRKELSIRKRSFVSKKKAQSLVRFSSYKKRVSFRKRKSLIKNYSKFLLFLKTNNKNFGFGSYLFKKSNIFLNLRFVRFKKMKVIRRKYRNSFRRDFHEKKVIHRRKNKVFNKMFLKHNSGFATTSVMKESLMKSTYVSYLNHNVDSFITVYKKLLVNFFLLYSTFSFFSVTKFLNYVLNESTIMSIFVLYNKLGSEISIEDLSLNYVDVNEVSLIENDFIFNGSRSLYLNTYYKSNTVSSFSYHLKVYLVFISRMNSSYLNKLLSNKYSKVTSFSCNNYSIYSFLGRFSSKKSILRSKAPSFISGGSIGSRSFFEIESWVKLRNVNFRFKKILLYYLYMNNITLLHNFNSYKYRDKTIVLEYKMKFYSSDSYYVDKLYLLLVYNAGKSTIHFYPYIYSDKYLYKNKYISIYNDLFVEYKYLSLHKNFVSSTNTERFNYYFMYKEFVSMKDKFSSIFNIDITIDLYKNSYVLFNKIYFILIDLLKLFSISSSNGVLVESLVKLYIYFYSSLNYSMEKRVKVKKITSTSSLSSTRFYSFSSRLSDPIISYESFVYLKQFPVFFPNLLKSLNLVPSYLEIDYDLFCIVLSYYPSLSEVPLSSSIDVQSLSNVFKSSSRY